MHRRIMILLVASAFVAAVHADVLKCYMCTSLGNKDCNSSLPTTNSLELVECTIPKLVEWQRRIAQHNVLRTVEDLFEVDDSSLHHHYQATTPMACAKMLLSVGNHEVTIRTCQTDKTEAIDPCKTMEAKMQNNRLGKVKECSLCVKDACNGATVLSPEIFYTLLSFLGALIHVAFYHWA